MEILAEAKVKCEYDSFSIDRLVLEVKFKKPNRIFKTKLERILCSSWWVGDEYRNRDEYLDDVLYYLLNRDILEKEAECMVIEELGLTKEQIERQEKVDKINELLKDNKFTVKVEVK